MMTKIREFFRSRNGTVLAVTICALATLAAVLALGREIGQSAGAARANDPVFIDSVTHKIFHYELKTGDSIPVLSPYTHRRTGYPPELCFWTKSGGISRKPTYVLVNQDIGKPGPTFCPVCGRLVVPHNPLPMPGMTPPPTRAQYYAMLKKERAASGAAGQ